MYLLDTNILLELLLAQEKAAEVQRFLAQTSPHKLHLSELAFYSLGIILSNRGKPDVFLKFMEEILEGTGVRLLKLETEEIKEAIQNLIRFKLDFDDAYQYTVAEKHDLTLVSFDKDFDRTERGRKTPLELLERQ